MMPPSDVYALFFHGPAYQVVASAWAHGTGAAARMADELPQAVESALPTLTPPRLVELCFQTAGLAQAARDGVLALPAHVDRVLLYPDGDEGGKDVQAVVTQHDGCYDCAALDAEGGVLVAVEGYRGIPLPGTLDAEVRRTLSPLES